MAATVKWIESTFAGAPQLTNVFGDMTAMMDAVLVNGFDAKTITSITRTGTVVNVQIAAGHSFKLDSVVRISGITQTEYNGDWRVNWIDTNNLRFSIATEPASPATFAGSPVVKVAPLGWDLAYTATNKRAYRSPNNASNRPYLRLDNSQPAPWVSGRMVTGRVHGGLAMSDIDTFLGEDFFPNRSDATSFPAWGWFFWGQSYNSGSSDSGPDAPIQRFLNSGSTQAPWTIVGDDRAFYFFCRNAGSYPGWNMYGFGDFGSFKASDPHNVFMMAHESYNLTDSYAPYVLSGAGDGSSRILGPTGAHFDSSQLNGTIIMKGYVGFGSHVGGTKVSLNTQALQPLHSGRQTGVPWPNGPDFSLLLHPAYLKEFVGAASHVRGKLPGLYCVHNDVRDSLANRTRLSDVNGLPGRQVMLHSVARADALNQSEDLSKVALDITGPWW